MLRVLLEIVDWIKNAFDNNFGIENDFTKYLKELLVVFSFSISPSNTFPSTMSFERFLHHSQAVFVAAVSINGLTYRTYPQIAVSIHLPYTHLNPFVP